MKNDNLTKNMIKPAAYFSSGESERFQSNTEVLHLDVWNFLPSQSEASEVVKEKLKKLNEVKDTKGLRQLVKDALLKSTGTTSSSSPGNCPRAQVSQSQSSSLDVASCHKKLVGFVEIPVAKIPASGLSQWHTLHKIDSKGNKRDRGRIHLTVQVRRYRLKVF